MTSRLCHLLISLDNESMALEEFMIDLCEESVNGALLVGQTSFHQVGANAPHRLSGCSRRISTTSPEISIRTRSRHAVEYITKCSALCLDPPSRSGAKRSKKISCPSPYSRAWCSPALQHPFSRDTQDRLQSRKHGSPDRLTISYQTMYRQREWGGAIRSRVRPLHDPGRQGNRLDKVQDTRTQRMEGHPRLYRGQRIRKTTENCGEKQRGPHTPIELLRRNRDQALSL